MPLQREWREEQRNREDVGTDTGLSLLNLQRYNDHSMESMAALYPVVETMKSFIPGEDAGDTGLAETTDSLTGYMMTVFQGAVVKRLADGQDVDQDGSHLAEMLQLSVIFICIEGLDLVAVSHAVVVVISPWSGQ